MIGLIVAGLLAALSPESATRLACALERYPDCAEVLQLVKVESRGQAVGVHTEHASRVSGAVFWRRAVERGLLHPERCAEHQQTDGGHGWGPRGAHGHVGAYAVVYLGDCAGPELLDIPLVSAIVAIRRLRVMARRYGLTTPAARAEAWRRGVGVARRLGWSLNSRFAGP